MSKQAIVLAVMLFAAGFVVWTVSNGSFLRPTLGVASDERTGETPSYSAGPPAGRPPAMSGEREYDEPEPAADGETAYEVVQGLRVRKDRNCTVTTHYVPNGDGTVSTVYACEPNSAGSENPYGGYSNETLAQMVYHDAKAAETLGMRFREKDQELAMSLIIRASALAGGDARPIIDFSSAYPEAVRIDGQPVTKTIRVQYVLNAVVELLGAEGHGRQFWEGEVRASLEDPEAAIRRFDEQARAIIAEMRAIQREVMGAATIRQGDGNA